MGCNCIIVHLLPRPCSFSFFKKGSFYFYLFIIVGRAGSSLQQALFSNCGKWDLPPRCSAQASVAVASLVAERGLRGSGLSSCGSGSRAQAQRLCRTGLAAPRHVGSSQIRDRTLVSCIGRSHQGSPQSPVLLSRSFTIFARLAPERPSQ